MSFSEDHWLHPCQCVPDSWGNDRPVTPDAIEDVPAGSSNMFTPAPETIVEGAFVCDQKYLLNVRVALDTETVDAEFCEEL